MHTEALWPRTSCLVMSFSQFTAAPQTWWESWGDARCCPEENDGGGGGGGHRLSPSMFCLYFVINSIDFLSRSFLASWDRIIRIIRVRRPFYWSLESRMSWIRKKGGCVYELASSSTSWRGESLCGSQKSVTCLTKPLFFVNFPYKRNKQPWSITSTLNMSVSSKVTLALATVMLSWD